MIRNKEETRLISLKEFADRIGVSYSTVRRMVASKSVRVAKPHRRVMIPESEVQRCIAPYEFN